MKMYKKVMAAALAGVMTVSMSATAFAADDDGYILKATNEDSKSSDNDLVIAIEGSVSSMDPANIPDTNAISATLKMIPPMTVQLYKALRDICRGISRSDEPGAICIIYEDCYRRLL